MEIPVSAIIVTKNEERAIASSIKALKDFDEIILVDSNSSDRTKEIAIKLDVRVENFIWDGVYPKKRQWCLDHIKTKHDWVLFIDADELMQPDLAQEIKDLELGDINKSAGFFIKGQYVYDGKALNFGLKNNKLMLFDRNKIQYPIINDLGLEGMGEIEGHYQPVLKQEFKNHKIGQLKSLLLHDAYGDLTKWNERHVRYAKWEAQMDIQSLWPAEPVPMRRLAKALFKKIPARGLAAFLHSYVLKLGFLDGARGLSFACSRMSYYKMIKRFSEAYNK